ncbi:MAG: AAA family ATPase [Massilibacteroides sp.]|nr:AAA family ATPase [Massilibacteroides sp.]
MKIIAIRGKNIASLEGEFEVDFTAEPLASANIFAISGPTGSGKSSLLDTMCLALFARTPRTDQAKELNVRLQDINDDSLVQSDPRFLLRRGTASGYAEADFIALNGHRYRACWSVSRALKKENGRLQNPRLTLFNLDNNSEEQGTRTELQQRIVELIGLSFEQFTRSVLLAQNDFSTFLKAEQGEKAALLEKLTGTELYSRISKKIFERNAEARTAFESLQTQIAGIELLPEAEENALKTTLQELESASKKLEQERKEWDVLNEIETNTFLLLQKKEQQQKEGEEKLTKALSLYEQAKATLDEETKTVSELETVFRKIQPALNESRKTDIELANALQLLQEDKTRLDKSNRLKKETEEKIQTLSLSLKQCNLENELIETWFVKFRSREKVAAQLPTLLFQLDAAERILQSIENGGKELKTVQTEKNHNAQDLAAIQQRTVEQEKEIARLNEQYLQLLKEIRETDTSDLEKKKEGFVAEREKLLQEQLLFSSTGTYAKELRKKLTENTPCPVCGSLQHPYANKETHARMQAIQTQILNLTQQIGTLDNGLKTIAGKQRQADTVREQMLIRSKTFTDTEKTRHELNNRQIILDDREKQLQTAKNENQTRLVNTLQTIDDLFEKESWREHWMENPSQFRKRLTDFVAEWQAKEKRKQELGRLSSGYEAELTSYKVFLEKHKTEFATASNTFEKQQSVYLDLQAKRKQLFDGKDPLQIETEYQKQIELKKKRLAQLQQTLNEQTGIAEQTRGQKEQIANDLLSLRQEFTKAQKNKADWLDAYQVTSGGRMPQERLSEVLTQKSTVDFRLRTHEANKKKISGLKDEAEQKQQISERWGKLNELAGSADGGKFRRIAQSYTLDILLDYANIQLKSLTNRYRLERVPDTLALQIVDSDMCDEIRTVHSLSGGESFLVSLALALGLSSLSSNRMTVESLFIDEGFGSLDEETLRVTMDALENLRTQGRKIGIISHVQEMTERILVQIKIRRLGNGRSRIEIV